MKMNPSRPVWAQEICNLMVERNITVKQLGGDLKINRSQLSNILSGYYVSDNLQAQIEAHFAARKETG